MSKWENRWLHRGVGIPLGPQARNDPHPDLPCDGAHATDGVWASRRQHLIQHHYADGCLGPLRGEAWARNRGPISALYRPIERRSTSERLPLICCFLPGEPSSLRDHLKMPVTLCEWTLFTIDYGGRSRWDHDFDIIAVRR